MDTNLNWIGDFVQQEPFLVDIPEDADELYFLSIFMTDHVLQNITEETNRYAKRYIDEAKACDKLPQKSRFRQWPEEGMTVNDLKLIIALTFYFGIVKKDSNTVPKESNVT